MSVGRRRKMTCEGCKCIKCKYKAFWDQSRLADKAIFERYDYKPDLYEPEEKDKD